jgi:hypothetical protein
MVLHPVDLHEHLVEMLQAMTIRPHRLNAGTPDLGGEKRTETVAPQPNRFMGDVNAPLMEKVFHIPQRQRVADVHHHHPADDLGS